MYFIYSRKRQKEAYFKPLFALPLKISITNQLKFFIRNLFLLKNSSISILDDNTGTSFIYIWNTGCGRCKRTTDYWQEAAANIDNANFYSLNYSDVGNRPLDNLLDQCENLKSNAITFPAIIRCENGKPVYFISTKKVYANENLEQLLREEMSS